MKFFTSFELTSYFSVSDPFASFDLVKYIRELYADREGWLAPFPWCEEFRLDLDSLFTRLKFVSRKKQRGVKTDDSVDMFQIFQSHEECSQPKRVLIEGKPGMGKTTYCHKIALNWAKKQQGGESFASVFLVLLLKCKDIDGNLWEAIDDQLLPEVDDDEKEKFFKLIRKHQSKVLLVLDGLDELPKRNDQLPIYKKIIQGRVLPESYLVVTARREVGVTVRECCHTLLEVEGFSKADAENFIQRYFGEEGKDLAEKLVDRLHSDETLRELTANPLNAALLCLLCEDFGGKLPVSRTLLYLEVVECLLRRYRQKMKLPETDQNLIALYQVQLEQLGSLALRALHHDTQYFDQSAFQGLSSDLRSGFGLLSMEAGRSKRKPSRSYAFLHKSFQEFFAALFRCGQFLDGKIPLYFFLGVQPRYQVRQVLMFTTGLLAQKCEEKVKDFIASLATYVNETRKDLELSLLCINECKREADAFEKELAQIFGKRLQLQDVVCYR